MAIAGFILAFLLAPIGFVLSVVGLIQTGKRGQKGKVLAIFGIAISLIVSATLGLAIASALKNVSTVADPECTTGKAAILDGTTAISAGDVNGMKAGLQKTIDGLNSAAAKAKHDDVRAAMETMAEDYKQLLEGLSTGSLDNGILAKIQTDANRIDELCTIGGGS